MSDNEHKRCLEYAQMCENSDCESSDCESSDNTIIEDESILYDDNSFPLKNTWILYNHTKSDSDTYDTNTKKVCEFDTVIKFWQIFNNYPKPSKLFNNNYYKPMFNGQEITSLSVFKKGIIPKWEDPVNILGAELSKRKFSTKNPLEELDNNWIDLLSNCVSENIDNGITGLRVVDSSSIKFNETTQSNEFKLLYRIELWFDRCEKRNIMEDHFKTILNIEDIRNIYYKEHKIVNGS